AGHAAEGYAAATGEVGVCIATSGPGATNLITALANATMDSTPMVAITGQVGSQMIGTDAFQEADIVGATMPLTKHSFLVTNAADVPARIAEAHYIARTGRPGPVLVDITKDAQVGELEFSWPPKRVLPGYKPFVRPNGRQVKAAARALQQARRPVLMVGGGTIRSGAAREVTELADLTDAAVVTTLMGRGGVPDAHPNHLGMPGMHGSVAAVAALQRADLIVALGARFDDRVTGDLASFAPGAKIVHADIDPAEISKNRNADIPIVGDIGEVVRALIPYLRQLHDAEGRPDLAAWWRQLNALRERYPLGYTPTEDGLMAPQEVIKQLGDIAGPEAIYVSGVGQHQMWAAQFIGYQNPGTWLNSGGLGTMGYAIPAAMGAKAGCP
ncbi:MAG: thiamine pyrophosphate-binding protein, partial [Bowdeniella nasicola]|nr:thiamine pyrophosphate-binding protein [Bowdeniella nasicola]